MEDTVVKWDLIATNPLSPALLWTVVAVALAASIWLGVLYVSRSRRSLLVLTRFGALILLIGTLLQPALRRREGARTTEAIDILVDRSASMGLQSAADQSRYDLAREAIAQSESLKELSKRYMIRYGDLQGGSFPEIPQDPPNGNDTAILEGIEARMANQGSTPVAATVVLTDGADRGRLSTNPEAAADLVASAPVTLVNVSSASFQDVGIATLLADEFGFVHNTLQFEVTLQSHRLAQQAGTISLYKDGQPLQSKPYSLEANDTQTLAFETKPEKVGEYTYEFRIEAPAGDMIASNNSASKIIQVVRDKIRVLHVAGRPSWDERFLRQHLKQNPNVDLIAFFILRMAADDQNVPRDELSLIHFPTRTLFEEKVDSFDVIIFQDFDHREYAMTQYLDDIRRAVEGGVGFVIMGTDDSFGSAYRGTTLEDIIPVTLDKTPRPLESGAVALTPLGARHPITALGDLYGGTAANRFWASLPPIASSGPAGQAKSGASSLLSHRGQPLVTVGKAKEGRVMAITSDELWRWRFSVHPERARSERVYHRFWSNALRWLVKDPTHQPIRLRARPRTAVLGEEIRVSLEAQTREYAPMKNAGVRLRVFDEEGKVVANAKGRTDENGLWGTVFAELPTGNHRVRATVTEPGSPKPHEVTTSFSLSARSEETSNPAPRPDVLAAIADATGGEVRDLDGDPFRGLPMSGADTNVYSKTELFPIWDQAWGLLGIAALLTLEWWSRRRFGLV